VVGGRRRRDHGRARVGMAQGWNANRALHSFRWLAQTLHFRSAPAPFFPDP
jgi:hypothetical protein